MDHQRLAQLNKRQARTLKVMGADRKLITAHEQLATFNQAQHDKQQNETYQRNMIALHLVGAV